MASLFGYLAHRFTTHPENLATEALNYVLAASVPARQALLSLLAHIEPGLPLDLSFETQVVGEDEARHDLVGRHAELGSVLILEAKFWAGLTAHQPVTYLARLPRQRPAVLVVVAPGLRFRTLWAELAERCAAADIPVGIRIEKAPEFWFAGTGPVATLALMSWRVLLDTLRRALELQHESGLLSDVTQLAGLAAQMDSDAFLPLRPEEITTAEVPRRMIQFTEIIDDLATAAVNEGLCSKKDNKGRALTPGTGAGYYGRYLRMGAAIVFVALEYRNWARSGATPFWLRAEAKDAPDLVSRLRASAGAKGSDSRVIDEGSSIWTPLRVPAGLEKTAVVEALLEQLRDIATLSTTPDKAAVATS
jgi:hypothetical protein